MSASRTLWALLLVALLAPHARADQPPPEQRRTGPADGSPPYFRKLGWRLPAGIDFGGALHQTTDNQAFFGLELSLDHLGTDFWYQLAVDLTAEFDGPSRIRISPGVGWHGYSVNAGYAVELAAHGSRSGLALRFERSIGGLAGIFARWDHFFTGAGREVGELGLFIKLPLFDWFEDVPGITCGDC